MVDYRGVKLNRVRSGTKGKLKMSKQNAEEFVQEIRNNFNKQLDVFIKADEALGKQDWDAFREVYTSMTKEQLEEIAMAQHLKTNEIYQTQRFIGDAYEAILRDITYCKDFVAFSDIKTKAEAVLLARSMMAKGKSPDEIRQAVSKATEGLGTSNIIVQ